MDFVDMLLGFPNVADPFPHSSHLKSIRILFGSRNLHKMKRKFVLMKFVDMFVYDFGMYQSFSALFTLEIS